MSAGILSGFEFGPGALNPYEQFKSLEPRAEIDDGVFVFDGPFHIPLAAALSHVQKAGVLLAEGDTTQALREAEDAEALAPDSAIVNATLGKVLDASGQRAEATQYDQAALRESTSVDPLFQTATAAAMRKRLTEAADTKQAESR